MTEYLCPIKVAWVTLRYCKHSCTITLAGEYAIPCEGLKLDKEARRIDDFRRD